VRIFRARENVVPSAGLERDQWVEDVCCRMASGNERSFEEFFAVYADRVFRLCLVLTHGNEHLSREILQMVMIRAARTVPICATEKKLWAWLSTVARNCFINHLRQEQKESIRMASRMYELESESLGSDSELFEALERSLEELDAGERSLIEAIYEKEMSHKMVAELWKSTPKSVENRIARLRRHLRDAILNKLKCYALF